MKKRQIKTVDIPSFFSLEKYRATFNFGIADWLVNLEARALHFQRLALAESAGGTLDSNRDVIAAAIQAEVGATGSDFAEILVQHLGHGAKHDAEKILKNPILKSEGFEMMSGIKKWVSCSAVHDFTALDFFSGDPGIDLEDRLFVEVDLHASVEKIVTDFTDCLRRTLVARNIAARTKKFTHRDFSDWAKNAILPYLDLTYWARVNGCEITQQVLGVTLFPDEYNVNLAERVRKVVVPEARKISRGPFIDALRSQAQAELAESKSKKNLPEK